MEQSIGISAGGKIAVGLVEGERVVLQAGVSAGTSEGYANDFLSMHMEELVETVAATVESLCREHKVDPVAVGMCFPGIIQNGIVEESPNLKQAKGANLCALLTKALEGRGLTSRVSVCNDADAVATGIAARRGHLEKLIRVWTLGQGIGFGRYPHSVGPCEGGHTVVTLDPKEVYCGCGGRGHLEGIMGYRAMRLRFLDLEPEEVFAAASEGDQRCVEFELLWHRALAAASATSIHLDGPGKFFITGANAVFIKVGLLGQYLQEMVTMSPLQGSVFEVVDGHGELAITGAAVNAARAAIAG
jgi:predicted NBD/HSP70 family sugar kinase